MKISFIPIRLREARKMCGYSLDQLTKAANVRVTRQSIYNYERGVMQPKPDMVKALAETLGVNESFSMANQQNRYANASFYWR